MTDGKLFHLCSVESTSAYRGIASCYLRTLALIGTDESDAYVVDVFDVEGGDRHDYLLHGSADEDSEADLAGVSLQSFAGSLLNAGAEFVMPKHQSETCGGPQSAYGF